MVKFLSKIWEVLTIFFAGIIAGIWVFVKFLDTPENEIYIRKIKNKNTSGTNSVDVNLEATDIKKNTKKRIRLFDRNRK